MFCERSLIVLVGAKHPGLYLFYTDGLVEAHNAEGEMFSFPRLKNLIRDHALTGASIELLMEALQTFTGADWDQEDDITLVVVRRAREHVL